MTKVFIKRQKLEKVSKRQKNCCSLERKKYLTKVPPSLNTLLLVFCSVLLMMRVAADGYVHAICT
jgi:hypothetical protein